MLNCTKYILAVCGVLLPTTFLLSIWWWLQHADSVFHTLTSAHSSSVIEESAYTLSWTAVAVGILLLAGVVFYGSIVTLALGFEVGYSIAKKVIISWLWVVHKVCRPIVCMIQRSPGLRTLVEIIITLSFFVWFRVLIWCDRIMRYFLKQFSSSLRHPSGALYSLANAADPNFQPCGDFGIDKVSSYIVEQYHSRLRYNSGDESGSEDDSDDEFDLGVDSLKHFSLNAAISLGNCSRLVYEAVPIIKAELESCGYTNLHFIHYKNTVGVVAMHNNDIIVTFRGTEPLNLMNYFTDVRVGMVDISTLDAIDEEDAIAHRTRRKSRVIEESSKAETGIMGKVHFGFIEALRVGKPKEGIAPKPVTPIKRKQAKDDADTHMVLKIAKIIGKIVSTCRMRVLDMWASAKDPVDSRFMGRPERVVTAYEQTVKAIETLLATSYKSRKLGKIFIAGHSMGGALAQVFFAQAVSERKPWIIDNPHVFVYTYGQPRCGDKVFTEFLDDYKNHLFRICNNNDIIPRLPPRDKDIGHYVPPFLVATATALLGYTEKYADPPGNLIFIDGSTGVLKINPEGGLRGISFLKMSGIINPNVIWKMRYETTLRILFRLVLPFFLNDHICGDYSFMLQLVKKNITKML